MSDSSNLASAIAERNSSQDANNSGGSSLADLFGRLSEGAVDLGLSYAEKELILDDQQAVAPPESAAAATPAGVPSGATLPGVIQALPVWAVPAAVTVVGVTLIYWLFRK